MCLFSQAPLHAMVTKLAYQGTLRQSGVPMTGSHTMVFRIFSVAAGGAATWTSAPISVNFNKGRFFVTLQTSGVDWEGTSPFLELEIDGVVLSPREELVAGAFALNSLLLSGKRYTSANSAPTSPSAGDLWYDTFTNAIKYYNGSAWVLPSAGSASLSATQTFLGQNTFSSQVTVSTDLYISNGQVTLGGLTAAPTATRGRLYFDPSGLGALKISLDGASFVPLSTGASGGGLSTILVNAAQLSGDGNVGNPITLLSSSATLQGNSFNVPSRLVQLDSSGRYPALDGSQITGLAATDPARVLKAGDTMSGDLQVGQATASTIAAAGYLTLANLAGAPAGTAGRLYYDSGAARLRLHIGSGFVDIATGTLGAGADPTRVLKTGDAMTGDLQVGQATASTIAAAGYLTLANLAAAPPGVAGRLYYDSSTGKLRLHIGSGFVDISTGTPNTGAGAALLALDQTFTGSNTFQKSSALSTPTSATAGSTGVDSPALTLRGQAWDTSGVVSSPRQVFVRNKVLSETSWRLSVDRGGPELFAVDQAGNVVSYASMTASAFFGDGAGIGNLNAGSLSAGTVPLARLSGITDAQLAAGASVAQSKVSGLSGDLAAKLAKAGDAMTGQLTMSGSTLTVTGQDAAGYSLKLSSGIQMPAGTVTAGLFVGSGAGLTNVAGTDSSRVARGGDAMTGQLTMSGSTLTVTGQDAAGYSLKLSSGISMPAGTVSAGLFVGSGAGLTGVSGTDGSRVAKGGDAMTGQLTMSGSTLTVTGQDAAGYSLKLSSGIQMPGGTVTAGLFVGSGAGLTNVAGTDPSRVARGGDAMTGQLTLSGSTVTVTGQDAAGYSLKLSSGISMPAGTVTAGLFVGNGAGLSNVSGTDASRVAKGGDTMSGGLLFDGAGTHLGASNQAGVRVGTHVFVTAGNVGIGTTLPGERLDVSGNVAIRGVAGPPALPPSGQGKLWYDPAADKLKLSEGGSAFVNIIGGVGGAVTLQGTSPGIADTGNLNLSGTGIFGAVGAGVNTPGARVEARGTPADSYTLRLSTSPTSYQVVATTMGQVGIGTANPGAMLDVANGSWGQLAIRATDTGGVADLEMLVPGAAPLQVFARDQANGGTQFWSFNQGTLFMNANKVAVNQGGMPAAADPSFQVRPTGASPVLGAYASGGASALLVANNGNVGIGTASPAARLHMSSGTLLVDGDAATSLRIGVSTFIVSGSGNVGIGTAVPGAKLMVKQASDIAAEGLRLEATDGSGVNLWKAGGQGPLNITVGGQDRVSVQSEGNVAIGPAQPTARLHVSSANAAALDRILAVSTGTPAGSEALVVMGSGRVGIGTTNPAYPLHVGSAQSGRTSVFIDNKFSGANTSGALRFGKNANDRWAVFTDASQNNIQDFSVYDAVAGAYRLYISSFGNVAIDSGTDPLGKLDVGGTLNLRSAPAVPPVAGPGQGKLWFDPTTNKLKLSENQGAYATVLGGVANAVTLQPNSPGVVDTGHFHVTGHGIVKQGLEVSSPTAVAADTLFKVSRDPLTAANEALVFMGDGRAGIGTTAPVLAGRLQVRGGTTFLNRAAADPRTDAYANADLVVGDVGTSRPGYPGDSSIFLQSSQKSSLSFLDDGQNASLITYENLKFTIGENAGWGNAVVSMPGNVGIGTPSPATKLHLSSGTVLIDGNASTSFQIGASTLVVNNQGRMFVGTMTDPGFGKAVFYNADPNLDASLIVWDQSGAGQGAQIYVAQNPGAQQVGVFGYNDSGSAGGFLTTLPNSAMLLSASGATGGLVLGTVAAAPLRFGTGGYALGNERMRIAAGGNVGVGTTDPQAKLEVKPLASDGYALWVSSQDATGLLRVDKSGDVLIGSPAIHDTTANPDLLVQGNLVIDGKLVQHQGTESTFESLAVTATVSAGQLFKVGAGTFTVLQGGNVGIGTAAPKSALDLVGGVLTFGSVSSSSTIRQDLATDDLIIRNDRKAADSDIVFATQETLERMRITGGGNVGIGTTNPGGAGTVNLQIAGGSAGDNPAGLRLSNPAAGITSNLGVVDFNNGATILGRISVAADGTADSGKIRLQTATGGALGTGVVIDRSGNVGIGAAVPTAKLDVEGNSNLQGTINAFPQPGIENYYSAIFSNNTTATIRFLHNLGTSLVHTDGAQHLAFGTNGANENMRIASGGNVGIGTTGPQAKLDIFQSGAINTTTPGTTRYGLHLTPQDAAVDTAAGITFGAGDSGAGQTAQAGIYSQFSAGYGTKMYFATTDSYATGAKTRMTLDAVGNLGVGIAPSGARLHVSGDIKGTGLLDVPNNLEIVQHDDARLTYSPAVFTCAAGQWCEGGANWGANRFSTNARYTNCEGESDCSAAYVELTLNANQYRTVLMSHLDWSNTRAIRVSLSFDGGATYSYHKTISTFRSNATTPYTSHIRAVASNLPLGSNVRVRLVAEKGRMHFEGFGLSKMIMPETDDHRTKTWRLSFNAGWTVACCAWGNVGPALSIITDGGPLLIAVDVPMNAGSHHTCQVLIDGTWTGTFAGDLETGSPFWREGLQYVDAGWKMWTKTRVVPGVPAGAHTVQMQCATDGGSITNISGSPASSLHVVELPGQ